MTVDEIFSELAAHSIQGLMAHDQLADYYTFLNLPGYAKTHEYQFFKENKSYKELCTYYITHYNKLINVQRVDDPKIMPEAWYGHSRYDVDVATRKNSIKKGLETWVQWEMDTKNLYENCIKELMNIGEVASAMYIKGMLRDNVKELERAEHYLLNKRASDYDISIIIDEQKPMREKYQKKLESI